MKNQPIDIDFTARKVMEVQPSIVTETMPEFSPPPPPAAEQRDTVYHRS
jgi:hypothetical protein